MVWEEGHWTGPDYDAMGKKKSVVLWRFDRPHMRAFHFAWFAFHICFLMWFAVPPLMTTIKKPKCLEPTSETCINCATKFPDPLKLALDKTCMKCAPNDTRSGAGCGGLGLTKDEITLSNAISTLGTIFVRILLGAAADAIGVRWAYIIILVMSAIPGFCIAAVTSVSEFIALRFLISSVGGSFVLTQLWTSSMFSSNIVGTANATSAGWGNLGGGVASAVIPQVFNSLIKQGHNNNMAWRYALIWPPAVLMWLAAMIYFFTDDNPYGRFSDIRKKKEAERKADPNYVHDPEAEKAAKAEKSRIARRSLWLAAKNWRTWIMFWGYAFAFGTDVAVYNNLPTFYTQAYSLNQVDAGLCNSLYSIFHLFARSLGGICSDLANKYWGIRGRIWVNFICATLMGVFLLVFSAMTKDGNGLAPTLVAMCVWAHFLTMTEGAIYSVVPFIEPTAVGGVSGIVGAGGNLGALIINFIFGMGHRPGFNAVGWLSIWSGMIIPLLWIPGVGSMFRADTTVQDPIVVGMIQPLSAEGVKSQMDMKSQVVVVQEPKDVKGQDSPTATADLQHYSQTYGEVPSAVQSYSQFTLMIPHGHPGAPVSIPDFVELQEGHGLAQKSTPAMEPAPQPQPTMAMYPAFAPDLPQQTVPMYPK